MINSNLICQFGISNFKQELPHSVSSYGYQKMDMQKFAELYSEVSNLPQVGEDFRSEEIKPLHKTIVDKCDGIRKKHFLNQVIQNNWSRAILLNFLDTDFYERQGKAITNFNLTFPVMQSDLAQEITKDSYKLDFVTLVQSYNEKKLKKNSKFVQMYEISIGHKSGKQVQEK